MMPPFHGLRRTNRAFERAIMPALLCLLCLRCEGSDEAACADAVAHIRECCPGIDFSPSCGEYSPAEPPKYWQNEVRCSDGRPEQSPDLDPSGAREVRATSCEEVRAAGLCSQMEGLGKVPRPLAVPLPPGGCCASGICTCSSLGLRLQPPRPGRGWSAVGGFGRSVWVGSGLRLWGSAENDIWAVGRSSSISGIWRWNGASWSKQSNFLAHGIWGLDAEHVWAFNDAAIVRWDGVAWSVVESMPDEGRSLYGLWGSAPNDLWAVGEIFDISTPSRHRGLVLHWDGARWNHAPVPAGPGLRAVWGAGANDVWAVGGVVLHWDGLAWARVEGVAGTSTLNGIWGTSAANVWIMSDAGTLLRWDGARWQQELNTWMPLRGIWGTPAGDLWIAADSEVLYRSR